MLPTPGPEQRLQMQGSLERGGHRVGGVRTVSPHCIGNLHVDANQ